jgi:DNA-binding transcriptional ArsR family regulator
MRSNAPGLLPILRSRHLAEMLTLLLLHPDAEYTLSEVAVKLSLPLTTVQREATRLSSSGLIRERRVGRSRLVSANPASRYTRPLTELVSLAFGPQFVIGEEFAALSAAAVAIYGSWAARYEGITGPRRTTSTLSSSAKCRAATCTRRPSGPSSASGCR